MNQVSKMNIYNVALVLHTLSVLAKEPVVETEYGPIRGFTKQVNSKPYTAFLGIPYAAPPVGELRFMPPQRHEGWTDVLDTQKDGDACPQDRAFEDLELVTTLADMPPLKYEQNEDCLFLNIYITGELSKDPEPKLPVFFFIHGGGNAVGSIHMFPGQVFVTEGEPIVMVAVQYRLGALGVMSSGDEHLKGMNSMKDQVFALQWIQRNIAKFGGDPNKVTISGCSTGGENVYNHMISPMSAGLFHKAIAQSPPSAWRYAVPSSMEKYFIAFADALDCMGPTVDILRCLRGKTWEEIKYAEFPHAMVTQRVIDGEFIPESPMQLWQQGKINDADLIYGITDSDGDIVIRYFGGNNGAISFEKIDADKQLEIFDWITPNLLNFLLSDKEILDEETITQFEKQVTNYEDLRTIVKGKYFDTAKDRMTRAKNLLDMSTHVYFLVHGYWELNQAVRKFGKARMYIFSHRTEALGQSPEGGLPIGGVHGSELAYQFGFGLDPVYGINLTEEEKSLARSMIKAWTSFAASKPYYLTMDGKPVEWPEFTEENKNVLLLDTKMSKDSVFNAEDEIQPVVDFWLAVQSLANIEEPEGYEDEPYYIFKDEF